MDKKNEHIKHLSPEIIQAYRSGKLSPMQMHQVEWLMLENPLYDEGMEGIDSIDATDFTNDIEELSDRLKQNTTSKKAGFWTIYTRIAATLLLLVGAAGLFYLTNNAELPTKELSQLKKTEGKVENDSSDLSQRSIKSVEPISDSTQSNNKATKPQAQKPVLKKLINETEPVEEMNLTDDLTIGELLKGKVAGIKVEDEETEIASLNKAVDSTLNETVNQRSRADLRKKESDLRKEAKEKLKTSDLFSAFATQSSERIAGNLTIRGQVIGANDSLPLHQVLVSVMAIDNSTTSKSDGTYELKNVRPGSTLVFRYIGYNTQEVVIDSTATVNIQLQVDNTSLGEVVVVAQGIAREKKSLGYSISGSESGGSSSKAVKAAPVRGFKSFNKYLKTKVRYPETAKKEKVRGRVTLEFDVLANGELSNFKIIKGLGYGCDEEAIRLVKEGPQWNPKTEGVNKTPAKSTVKIKVRFRP